MVIAGILALIYPLVSSVALALFLGWILIISGIVQGIPRLIEKTKNCLPYDGWWILLDA